LNNYNDIKNNVQLKREENKMVKTFLMWLCVLFFLTMNLTSVAGQQIVGSEQVKLELVDDFNATTDFRKDTVGMSLSHGLNPPENDLLVFRLTDSDGNIVPDPAGYIILTAWNAAYSVQNPARGKILRLSSKTGGYRDAVQRDTLLASLNDKKYGYGKGYAVFDGSKISYSKATYIRFKAAYSKNDKISAGTTDNPLNLLQFVHHTPKLLAFSPAYKNLDVVALSPTPAITLSVSDSFGNVASHERVKVSSHLGTGEIFYGTSRSDITISAGKNGAIIDLDRTGKTFIRMKVGTVEKGKTLQDSLIFQVLEVHQGGNIITPPHSNKNLRKTIGIRIISELLPLEIISESLPEGFSGKRYWHQLKIKGGILPYSWNIISGKLPDGINLSSETGLLRGKLQQKGTFIFAVQVKDSNKPAAIKTRKFRIEVK